MNKYVDKFSVNILSIHRYAKRSVALITDISLCIFCTWLAFILRLEELILFKNFNFYPVVISVLVSTPIFWIFGLYRTVFRYSGLSIIYSILASSFVYGLIFFLIIAVYGLKGVPRSIGIIQPMLLFFAILSSRLFAKFIFTRQKILRKNFNKKNILIYGAGDAGRQLAIALENSLEFKVEGFLDDNNQLHKQVLFGKTVYSPLMLKELTKLKDINIIFLALPSISRSKRNQIIKNLNKFKINVKTLPSVSEIVDGKITISDIKDLNIDDLLNREEIKPDIQLLTKNINLKTVLVTGAGGSIGSELCRQILRLKPNKLILLDLNEFALYKIYEELKLYNYKTPIISLLINAQDQNKLEKIFETFDVNTIYHAAAYKHVPLVEENICEGVKNNVFSTLAVTRAAVSKKISNLVLISSDKAVRPTNVMGASKRLSELCMQGIYNSKQDKTTNFSIVRFGNVLESSGSVIPKFKKQIKEGGPVTLTHKEVSRYFMTVTEAAQLVIQAGAMGKHSEVFVLDMGKSVKIIDLIYKMINLSGLSVKNEKNPNGDIEVEIIGLRPGEKLYEELLIGDNPLQTNHPKIKKTNDPFVHFDKLEIDLNNLKNLVDNYDSKNVKNLLEKILSSYKSNSKMIDQYYLEKQRVFKKN